jgi:asparagine synthase (glutamine-hydrolysing)
MCGIAGIVDASGQVSRDALAGAVLAMSASLRHRGPDADGIWLDPEAGVALGHRRLSILDLSEHGAQPMASHDGRYAIVFNGEIYNFQSIRAALAERGSVFRGTSDTEVMLEAFAVDGVARSLEKLNGMFAFALWDRRDRVLWLGRDRLGEKPLYHGWSSGGAFLFASELRALVAHPAFDREVDRDALALLLRHCYVPGPHTIFRGVKKLPPGHLLRLSRGASGGLETSIEPYWRLDDVAREGLARPFRGSESEAVSALDELLGDAVRMRMVADVPLGAFLSGGIDSTAIVALMQASSTRKVKTFSIGFDDPAYDEAPYAKAVAAHLGTSHTELYVAAADVKDVVERLPDLYDEPFADSSQIPTYIVSRLARRDVTVSLSGDGGDELFFGYGRYPLSLKIWNVLRRIPEPLRRLAARTLAAAPRAAVDALMAPVGWALGGELRGGTLGERVQKDASLLACPTPEALYHRLMSHWKDPARVVLGAVEPPTLFHDRARSRTLPRFSDRMMAIDQQSYLPDDILVKVDRASMAVGLEARVPLLDPRVVAFAWRLPFGMKYRHGKTKWLLRRLLDKYVPARLIERPKRGFGIPVGALLRGTLRDWAEDLLREDVLRSEGYLSPAIVRERWADHLSGRHDWSAHLWDVLAFQAWLRGGTARKLRAA